MAKRITKSEWKKISITGFITILAIFLRYYLGMHLMDGWKFMLDVIEGFISIFIVALVFFIFKQYKLNVLK